MVGKPPLIGNHVSHSHIQFMPQTVTLYRMLVATPGDCSEERKLIPQIVRDWNASHSLEAAVIVEPVLWETHARPELGERPQAIINRQLVDSCDFVVGIFWTRLGKPTGVAASGTAEELERFRSTGKNVLLYFSTAPIAPDRIDLEQYRALREYQTSVQTTGLAFSYAGIHDFERLFSRHLAQFMASLTAPTPSNSTETLARSLAKAAPPSERDAGILEALQTLRRETRFFWPELTELPPHRSEFVAEMQSETFKRAKPALDYLAKRGHLTYRADHAYDNITDGSSVFNVTVQSVTTQIKNLAKHLATQPQ